MLPYLMRLQYQNNILIPVKVRLLYIIYSAYFQTSLEWQLQFASFDHNVWEI